MEKIALLGYLLSIYSMIMMSDDNDNDIDNDDDDDDDNDDDCTIGLRKETSHLPETVDNITEALSIHVCCLASGLPAVNMRTAQRGKPRACL